MRIPIEKVHSSAKESELLPMNALTNSPSCKNPISWNKDKAAMISNYSNIPKLQNHLVLFLAVQP